VARTANQTGVGTFPAAPQRFTGGILTAIEIIGNLIIISLSFAITEIKLNLRRHGWRTRKIINYVDSVGPAQKPTSPILFTANPDAWVCEPARILSRIVYAAAPTIWHQLQATKAAVLVAIDKQNSLRTPNQPTDYR